MPNLTIMVGPSGAGKSTWIKSQLEIDPNIKVVSTDDIREKFFGVDEDGKINLNAYTPLGFSITFGIAVFLITLFLENFDVIYDATNLKRYDRMSVITSKDFVELGDIPIRYVVIDRPLEEKLESFRQANALKPVKHTNEDIIIRHHNTFQSNLNKILAGDNLPFVTVEDTRKI